MKKYQIYLTWILIFIFFVHFLFTLIYATDGKYTSAPINKVTAKYMLPLFHQNWKLFAPDPPPCELKVLYRYHIENETSTWNYLSEDFIKKHHTYRISWHGKMLRMHEYYARNLISMQETMGKTIDYARLRRTKSYYGALTEAKKKIDSQNVHPSAIQVAFTCVCLNAARNCKNDTLFMPIEPIRPSFE